MKRFIIILVDLILVFGAILLSFIILKQDYLANFKDNITAFYIISPFIIPLYLGISYVFGMMSLQRKNIIEILYTVFIVSVALTISITALIFFMRDSAESYPRSVILLSGAIYYVLLSMWRIFLHRRHIYRYGKRKVAIIGDSNHAIQSMLEIRYAIYYEVIYITLDDINYELLSQVDDIFISDEVPLEIRESIWMHHNGSPQQQVYFIPKVSDLMMINAKLYPFGDIPFQQLGKLHLTQEESFVKRIIDVVISAICLLLTFPLWLIIMLAIKLDGGPVFFIQERLTKGGRLFNMIKFRTMRTDAEAMTGPILSTEKDSRITTIGRLLRATRLDELPQFWNILKGEMSLVGPRPERPFFADKIAAELPAFQYRLHVKAGLTGLAQVMGKYNTDFKQKLQYDLYYINNFSILKDLLIMLQTIKIIFWKESHEGVKNTPS